MINSAIGFDLRHLPGVAKFYLFGEEDGENGTLTTVAESAELMYEREIAQFVDTIVTDATFGSTAADALAALHVSLAALESIQTGQPVPLPSF